MFSTGIISYVFVLKASPLSRTVVVGGVPIVPCSFNVRDQFTLTFRRTASEFCVYVYHGGDILNVSRTPLLCKIGLL
jgi:hypothetical protein